MRTKITVLVVALLVIVGFVGWLTWSYFFKNPSVQVTTATVERDNLREEINASGKVMPAAKVNVISKLTGKITAVSVSEGDMVEKDQIICQLDSTEWQLKVSEAEAQLSNTQANLQKIDRVLREGTSDTPTPTGPGSSTDYSQEDRRAAQAQVDKAKAALDLAKAQLEDTKITAPTAGTVVELRAVEGELAQPTKPVAVVVNPEEMQMEAQVDETDIRKVKVGQEIEVRVDAYPDKTLKGEVVEVGLSSTKTSGGGTAYPVKARVTVNEGVTLRSGMSGDVDIIVAIKQGVLVMPIEALTERNGKDVAFVDKDGRLEMREVSIGISTQDSVEVKQGLEEGEKVATEDVAKLKGGERAGDSRGSGFFRIFRGGGRAR